MSCYPCLKGHIQHTTSRITPEELKPTVLSICTHKPVSFVILILMEKKNAGTCPSNNLKTKYNWSSMSCGNRNRKITQVWWGPLNHVRQLIPQSRNNSHYPLVFFGIYFLTALFYQPELWSTCKCQHTLLDT